MFLTKWVGLESEVETRYCLSIPRNLLDQTVRELQQQVTMMRQRENKVMEQNRELQHNILDLESKLEEVQDRNQTAFEMVSQREIKILK